LKKIFNLKDKLDIGDCFFIEGNDYHHLVNVLRIKTDDKFIIGDLSDNEFTGIITSIDKNKISVLIENKYYRININNPYVILLFSVLKGEKNEFLLQKCTEIGIDEFIPVITQNTIIKLNKNNENKFIRWNKIVKEAAMQACTRKIPKINQYIMFDDIKKYDISNAKFFGDIIEADISLNKMLKGLNNPEKISFFIGPEGDFTDNEIMILKERGWIGVNISDNILKSETAAILAASVIVTYFK